MGAWLCTCSCEKINFLVCLPPKISNLIFPSFLLHTQLDTGRSFDVKCRFDTDVELMYFRNGGILNYMIRKLAQ